MFFAGRRWRRKATLRSSMNPRQLREMRALLPFPEPPFNYRRGSRDKTLLRSLPPVFVDILRSLGCARCSRSFSTVRPAYVSKVCTHLLCPRCVVAASFVATTFSQCPVCLKDISSEYLSYGRIEYHMDSNFKEVLKILETTPGFRCMDCGRLQPRHNSVQCADAACGRRARFDARYSCVWCAHKYHRDCAITVIEENQRASLRTKRNEWICSFDTTHMAAWALVHCGLCLSLLNAPMPGKTYNYTCGRGKGAVPLKCGHYACSDKKCRRGYFRNGTTQVYCNFCNDVTTGDGSRFAPLLSELLALLDFTFICANCGPRSMVRHPRQNRGIIVREPYQECAWCDLQNNQWTRNGGQ